MCVCETANALRNYETLTGDIVSNTSTYEFLGEASGKFHVVERSTNPGEVPKIWDKAFSTVKPDEQVQEIGSLGFRELDKRRRVQRERTAAYFQRLQMAVIGGAVLIVPMLIMALHGGLVVDLVVTSVATVVFGAVAVVFATDSTGRDVFAMTTAYAAVLVVFVGASLAPSSSSSGSSNN